MTTTGLPVNSTNVRNLIALGTVRIGMGALWSTLPQVALQWAERLLLSPTRHDWPAAELPWRDAAQTGTLHTAGMPVDGWDGIPMRTYRWGEAKRGKVALIHGWSGRATQLHAFIAPLVAAGYQVVAIDAPGHGASGGNRASVLHFANAVTRLLRNEGGVEAIIAHSLGGASTVYALSSETVHAGRVVLISPSADLHAYARHVGRLLRLDGRLLRQLQQRMETRLGLLWDDLNAITRAATLHQPALIIHDQGDKEVSAATGTAIASAWPGASLKLTQGLGHRRILRDADVVDAAVRFITA
jgi:pimeloyl-ACP methyl ester carboxylesterase